MLEWELFPKVAADVAMQAINEGVALKSLSWDEVYQTARKDILETQRLTKLLQDEGYIPTMDEALIKKVMEEIVN